MSGSRKKLPKDANQLAAEIVRRSLEEHEPEEAIPPQEPSKEALSQYFSKLGKKGGEKGGKARAKKLTAKQRQEIAKKAAEARWSKQRNDDA